jgi:hypothetical protein
MGRQPLECGGRGLRSFSEAGRRRRFGSSRGELLRTVVSESGVGVLLRQGYGGLCHQSKGQAATEAFSRLAGCGKTRQPSSMGAASAATNQDIPSRGAGDSLE